jgi:hypothetical protein
MDYLFIILFLLHIFQRPRNSKQVNVDLVFDKSLRHTRISYKNPVNTEICLYLDN